MKFSKYLLLGFLFSSILFSATSCDDDDDEGSTAPPAAPVGDPFTLVIEDLFVGTALDANEYTLVDLETGTVLLNQNEINSDVWDLAILSTEIRVNGGSFGSGQGVAQVILDDFDNITEAPEDGYNDETVNAQAIPNDETNGWWLFTGPLVDPSNAVLPHEFRTIVLRTGSGNYAKLEIQSYYKGNPDTNSPEFSNTNTRPPGGYYSFTYRIQPDGSRDFE